MFKLKAVASFDFIIIGAGSAGCVLADRLSADGRHRVLLLEAGGSDRRFWIRTPIGYGRTFTDPAVNWRYEAAPSPGLNGRTMYWPRGRVLGGSSSINALVYCRGLPIDFDGWRALGNPGWGWSDVQPYFERSERRVDTAGQVRGAGALDVQDVSSQLHVFKETWTAVAAELNLPTTDDFNGAHPEGLGCYQVNIRQGRRHSAADAFLRPALRRQNLLLETHAWISKIRIAQGRAVGVTYHRGNEVHDASAAREVLVCAGAVNSPQLLQLSGIGPAATLRAAGIEPRIDNSNVGGHLQDHLAAVYSYRATQPTLNDVLRGAHGRLRAGLQYLLTRRGPLSLSVNQFGGFVRADPAAAHADTQLYFNPVTYGTGDARRKRIALDTFSGFYLCFQPARPTSTGRIDIVSNDFRAPPRIAPNYLSTEKDCSDVVQGARALQSIARSRAMRGIIASPIAPDLDVMSAGDMLADFRARAATVYHPVGTCRMGQSASDSVVDARLRVHGLEGLRVVDASVFPTVTSANTHAPTLMVAQRAADLILEGGS